MFAFMPAEDKAPRERSMLKVATCLIMACLLSGPLVGAQQSKDAAAPVPRIFEIVSKVYWSLDSRLRSSEAAGQTSESEEARKWSSDIRNYNIEIMEYGGKIDVTFSVRPFKELKFEGRVYHYVLNETTGEILEQTADR